MTPELKQKYDQFINATIRGDDTSSIFGEIYAEKIKIAAEEQQTPLDALTYVSAAKPSADA